MKRSKKIMILMLFAFFVFYTGIQKASADVEHQFSFTPYDCGEFDTEYFYCLGPNGDGDTPVLDLDDVEAGDIIKLGVHYIPSDTAANLGYSLSVMYFYNPTYVEPLKYDGETYVEQTPNTNNGGPYPPMGTIPAQRNLTNWSIAPSDVNSVISAVIRDSKGSSGKVLDTEGDLFYVYFTVKDAATSGKVISFNFDTSPGKTKMANNTTIKTTDLDISIGGAMSTNNALGTLEVKKGTTTYTLTPTFTENDTTVTSYSTVVPNHITSVDINATAYDTNSTIIGYGTKDNLKIGDNTFDIKVTAQSGDIQTYQVTIRRLNNDARLSSLSLTDINLGTFSPTTTTYNVTVPYATNSTTISADVFGVASASCTDCTAGDTTGKATIKSGTGFWTLSNSGTTINTKDIVVQAENCDSKYDSVPGNSGTCVEKTYTINVTRTAPSTIKTLSDLTVDGTTVTGFSPTTYNYDLGDVSNTTTTINVGATVTDTGKASIISTLGNKSLAVGDNTITVTVKAEDGSTQDYNIKIRRLSNDSSLSALTVTSTNGGTFTPTFSSTLLDYYTYTAHSDDDRVTISATPTNTNATIVSGTGEKIISDNPTVNVTVQAEDGSQSIYIIKLVRAKSDNNKLSTLSVDGYTMTPTFNPDDSTTTYTVNVASTVTSVNVSATTADSRATIESGTGSKNLVGGSNPVQIAVKAENGTLRYYNIDIVKTKKTTATLSDLTADGATVPGFSSTTLEYTLTSVPFETTQVVLGGTLSDPDSSVSGLGTILLSTGDNKLYVTVTAEDGVTQTQYIINIERGKDYNNYLSDLTIDGTTITGFIKTKNDYTLTVPNSVTSLSLIATPESSAATVLVSGNSGFITTGTNSVSITVTAENGDTNIYTIDVTREKSTNNYLSGIALSDGTLTPGFTKENQSYSVNVDRDVTTMILTPTVEDSSATSNVSGPALLEFGSNTFTIDVTAEDPSTPVRTYTIIVTRNKSNNSYLSNLSIDGVTVTGFTKENQTYMVTVPSNTTSVQIGATPEDSYSTVTGEGLKTINAGDNTFTIDVTPEDGSTARTYTLVISRAKSNDATLGTLSISGATINETISPSTMIYTANVPYETTTTVITATPNDSNAVLTGDGSKTLNTGNNDFDIIITAEDGTTQSTYRLTVIRAKNTNANLTNITISGGANLNPVFDPDTDEYTASVPNNIAQVQIIAFKEDPNATITGDGLINLNTGDNNITITVTAEDGVTQKEYKIKLNRERSSDATLKSLVPAAGTLDPVFDPDTTSYNLSVSNEIENLTITATPTSDAASVTITGNNGLNVGDTSVNILVVAEDGTTNTYTILVTRQPSSNNFLASLSATDIDGTEYITTFNKSTLEYSFEVENEIDTINITGTLEDSSSTVTGFGSKTLSIGDNSFTIEVLSETNVPKEYVVKINRKSNANTYLASLEVVGYAISPSFVKTTTAYTLTVPSNVDKVTVNALPEASTSTVSGTGEMNLVTGTNTLNIDVTAENGDSLTYVITVTKTASSDSTLSSLTINPGTLSPSFSSEIIEYTVSVDNSTTMATITATSNDSSATIFGDGLKSLNVGNNTFEIEVTAEDNSKTIYKIIVNREASDNNYLLDLTIDGVTVTGFAKENLEYELSVDNDITNIVVDASVEDITAVVGGLGNQNLSTGLNVINIPVTAEDGSVKTYVLKVTRAKSNNNYLSSLSATEGVLSPVFDKATVTYAISVPYETTNLTLSYTTEDETATVNVEQNSGFTVGLNPVLINVVAEDNSLRTYTLNVTRQPEATNFLTGITVTDNNNITYALSPVFNKTTYNYEVELGSGVTQVNVDVTKQEETDTVIGDGTVTISAFPQEQLITVTNSDSLVRTYKLKFVKGLSSNNNLSNLSVDKGTLNPEFTKDNTSYIVNLPAGTTSLYVTATPDESTQSISGDGSQTLVDGDNTISITVTAENGSVNTYTILAKVGSTDDNKLSTLSVDKGTLSPEFDPSTYDYVVNIDPADTDITITATGPNNISGTGTKTLTPGVNTFTITTEKDGETNTYTITVNNGPVSSNKLISLSIDGFTLNETFNKNTNDYTLDLDGTITDVVVNATPEVPTSTVTISGNNGLIEGDNTITITVNDTLLGDNVYTIKVSNINKKITSTIHTVGAVYIPTILELKTAAQIKSEMTNPDAYLHIYDTYGNELADGDRVCNGQTIKLIINGIEYDSKTLIIKGDVNGSGEVEVADIILIERYILKTGTLTPIQLEAGDTNDDGNDDVADLLLIERHILKNYDIFTKEAK